MDLVAILLNEISQREKNKYHMTNETNKTKPRLTDTENRLVVAKREEGWVKGAK